MDGITAIFRSLALELASDGIETMKRAISHCGPDDGGIVYLTGSNIGWEPVRQPKAVGQLRWFLAASQSRI